MDASLVVPEEPRGRGPYAGWEVARNHDLSVVWFSELVGDITWTRAILVMEKTPTPEQTDRVTRIMPRVHRLCTDKTGMGSTIFETMDHRFPGKVEGITFTQATKESMATKTKRRMEKKRCRLPNDQAVWQSFRSVRKSTTALGQIRFDTASDKRNDHSDRRWSFALAESAVEQRPIYGLLEYWRQEAEKLKVGCGQGPSTGAEIAQERGRAQIKYAQDIGCFGAEKIPLEKDRTSKLRTRMVTEKPACCPKCQATSVARVAGKFRCGQCALQWGGGSGPRLPSRRDLVGWRSSGSRNLASIENRKSHTTPICWFLSFLRLCDYWTSKRRMFRCAFRVPLAFAFTHPPCFTLTERPTHCRSSTGLPLNLEGLPSASRAGGRDS